MHKQAHLDDAQVEGHAEGTEHYTNVFYNKCIINCVTSITCQEM